jgi:hypothetical protein
MAGDENGRQDNFNFSSNLNLNPAAKNTSREEGSKENQSSASFDVFSHQSWAKDEEVGGESYENEMKFS